MENMEGSNEGREEGCRNIGERKKGKRRLKEGGRKEENKL